MRVIARQVRDKIVSRQFLPRDIDLSLLAHWVLDDRFSARRLRRSFGAPWPVFVFTQTYHGLCSKPQSQTSQAEISIKDAASTVGFGGLSWANNRRRTNVQQLTCKLDLSNSFYYLFFSFVLIELKPFVLKGKVLGEKFWKSAKKC